MNGVRDDEVCLHRLGDKTRDGRVGTGLASAGLKTNQTAQVIDVDGDPIPGLYAVGNTGARLEFGGGYNSGMVLGAA